jgi:3-oxoacyl-(acyl-carrier-protein) synthase
MNDRAAAITGIGVISSLGIGFDELRESLAAGESGIGEISNFDASSLPVQLAGEVTGFELADHISSLKTYIDRTSAFGLAASAMALAQADWLENVPPEDVGLCFGTAWGCEDSIQLYAGKLTTSDPKFAPPLVFTHGYANAPNSLISIEFKLHGHNVCFSGGACSGASALDSALLTIRRDSN